MQLHSSLSQSIRFALIQMCLCTLLLAGCGGDDAPSETPETPGGGNLTGVVTTLAGGTPGFLDDIGTAARFLFPTGITSDGTHLYVADTDNNRIRQIVLATGLVTTFAGEGVPAFLDGTGTAARFFGPRGIASDGTNLYVADSNNNRIRQIVIATGVVTTLAGDGVPAFLDGPGTTARFFFPTGITSNGTNLYVADSANHRIRQIVLATGEVTTLAGSSIGFLDGTGTAAQFFEPSGITSDGTNLYVADFGNNLIRQIVIATGVVTTLAGNGVPAFLDGTGTAARFAGPIGINSDGTNLFVADTFNHRIRKIVVATGAVTTLAGDGVIGDLDGTGTAARLFGPRGIISDGTNLYVADTDNHRIRRIQ